MRSGSLLRHVWVAVAPTAVAACASLSGLDSAPASDGGTEAKSAEAAAPPRCVANAAGDYPIDTLACWETYPIPMALDMNPGYAGGTFDGRYVYFASGLSDSLVRFDTRGSFTDDASWTSFNTSGIETANAVFQYLGTVFDGRYLYLVPNVDDLVRYDTHGDFTTDSSWIDHVIGGTASDSAYQGGTFDGRYVYYAPAGWNGSGTDSIILRVDTTASFTTAGSWSTFDVTALGGSSAANPPLFAGALFDGRYVYFMPNDAGSKTTLRYDSTASFASPTSWETFDVGTLSSVVGFVGGMFDGTTIYFIPIDASGAVVAYDTSKSFTSASSWIEHLPEPGSGMLGSAITPGFGVGAFDGQFLYVLPSTLSSNPSNGLIVRESDTAGAFLDAGAWSTFDTKALKTTEFGAAVFDGEYLYLAPSTGGAAFARFHARSTSSQPKLPHYFGSFF